MTKALSVDPDIGLRELLEISQDDQYSVQYSPFLQGPGGQLGGTIIRRASPIKGMSEEQIEQQYPEIYSGLQEAQQMARDHASGSQGEGVAVIEQEGQLKIVSQGAANLAQEGKKGDQTEVIRGGLNSYSEAIDVVNAEGESPHRPRIA